MRFLGVNNQHTFGAAPVQQMFCYRDCRSKPGDIIAQCFAETTFQNEVALHIDHDDGRMFSCKLVRIGERINFEFFAGYFVHIAASVSSWPPAI